MKFVTADGGMGSPILGRSWSPRKRSTTTTNCKRNLSEQLDAHVPCSTDDESAADGPRTLTPTCKTWPMLSQSPVHNPMEATRVRTERQKGKTSMLSGNMFKSPRRKRNVNDDESRKINGQNPNDTSAEIINDAVSQHYANTSTPMQNSAVLRRIQEVQDEGTVVSCSDGEYLYPCHECGKAFDGLLDLTDHTLEHSNEKSYVCDLCGELFTTKKELKKHNKTWHMKERQCDHCGKILVSTRSRENHKKKHQIENSNVSMEIPNDTETTKNEEITNTTLEGNDKKSRQCDLCGEIFATKKELKKHNEAFHSKERQCDECGKVFISTEAFESHKTRHHFENVTNISTEIAEDTGRGQSEGIAETSLGHSGEQSYECDLCGCFFATKKNLKRHNETCHSKERQCNQCGKVSTNAEAFESHKKKYHFENIVNISKEIAEEKGGSQSDGIAETSLGHSGEKSYECDLCGKFFAIKKNLKKHNEACHSKERQCDQCGKVLTSAEALESHKKKHHIENVRSISTEILNETDGSQNEGIVETSLEHNGEKSYECDLCGKLFAIKKNLKKHKTCHNKERQCDQCGKVLANAEALERHKTRRHLETEILNEADENEGIVETSLEHSGKTLNSEGVQCDQCTEAFTSAEFLENHMKKHSENVVNISTETSEDAGGNRNKSLQTSHQCDLCGKSFRSAKALENHKKKRGAHSRKELKKHKKTLMEQCDQCGKSFKSADALESHKKKRGAQHGRTSYECDKCGSKFFKKRELKMHRTQHDAGELFSCTGCAATFKDRPTLLVHLAVHRKVYQCEQCGHIFFNRTHLSDHIRTHKGIKPHKCKECGDSFGKNYNLKRHILIKHSKMVVDKENDDKKTEKDTRHKCDCCNKTFKMKQSLKRHQEFSKEKHFKCTHCSFSFGRKSDMTKHIKQMHSATIAQNNKQNKESSSQGETGVELRQDGGSSTGPNLTILETEDESSTVVRTGKESFPCKHCCEVFSRKVDLRDHRRKSHLAQRRYHCEKCYQSFKRKCHLDEHKELHDKPVQCKLCGKLIQIKRKLRGHMKTYHRKNKSDRSTHNCEKCGELFKKKDDLDKHIKRLHNENSPKKCNVCDKSFLYKSDLTRHQNTHSALKLFSCDLCGKSFGRKYNLTRHRANVHNCEEEITGSVIAKARDEAKPFSCNLCKKSFGRKHLLTRHIAVHNPIEQAFSCDVCDKSFSRKYNLTRHRATHEEPQSSGNVSTQKPGKESESENNVNLSESFETKRKLRKPAQSPPDGVNGSIQDCEICGKLFKSKQHLDKHMKKVHEGSRENHADTLSEILHEENSSQKSTSKNGETSRHENSLQCKKCKRSFSHAVNLKKHMKLHYPRAGDPLACTECLKMFEDRGEWTEHIGKMHNHAIA